MHKRTLEISTLALTLALATVGLAQTLPQAGRPRHRVRMWNGARAATPEELARINVNTAEYGRYEEAFRRGDLRAASAIAKNLVSLEPENDEFACGLADVLFREGRYDEAYAEVASFLQKGAQRRVLLRVALASAHRGERRSGVEDYCRAVLAEKFPASELKTALPPPGSRNSTELCALLALGVTAAPNNDFDAWGRLYYGLALRLDPLNPIANFCLGDIEKHQRNWDLAVRRFRDAMARGDAHTKSAAGRRIGEVALARALADSGTEKPPARPVRPMGP